MKFYILLIVSFLYATMQAKLSKVEEKKLDYYFVTSVATNNREDCNKLRAKQLFSFINFRTDNEKESQELRDFYVMQYIKLCILHAVESAIVALEISNIDLEESTNLMEFDDIQVTPAIKLVGYMDNLRSMHKIDDAQKLQTFLETKGIKIKETEKLLKEVRQKAYAKKQNNG